MRILGITTKLYMSTSSKQVMRAIVYEKAGGREVISYSQNHPMPKIKEDEVLVKGRYAGVNFIDTYFRSGLYPVEFPFVPGTEGSGQIEETGAKVTGFQKGLDVVYMANATYAEYTAVPESRILALPQGIDLEVGAAGLLQGLTALTMIREGYEVKKGDWILIHAAAGGAGLNLVQMCAAAGANIIGTASTDAKIQLAREHGAQHMVKYTEDSVLDTVRRLTDGKGVHAVLDGVGKTTFDESLEAVRPMGTVISFGNASGAVPPFAIARLGAKNVKLMRPRLFPFIEGRERLERYADELFGMIRDGRLKIRKKVYPLSDAAKAQEDLEGRKTTGKLLLSL